MIYKNKNNNNVIIDIKKINFNNNIKKYLSFSKTKMGKKMHK